MGESAVGRLSAEELEAIRERYGKGERSLVGKVVAWRCTRCLLRWPGDAVRLLDEVAALEASYESLYNATRDLCALVDVLLPNQIMSPDEYANAAAIVARMSQALAERAGESE